MPIMTNAHTNVKNKSGLLEPTKIKALLFLECEKGRVELPFFHRIFIFRSIFLSIPPCSAGRQAAFSFERLLVSDSFACSRWLHSAPPVSNFKNLIYE